jgi:hypothetical protein
MNFFGSFPGFQTQYGGSFSPSTTYGQAPGAFASSNRGFNSVGYQAAPQAAPPQAPTQPAPQAQPSFEQLLMALFGGPKGMGGNVPYASGGRGYGSAQGGSGQYGSPEQDQARQRYQAGGFGGGGFNPFLISGAINSRRGMA